MILALAVALADLTGCDTHRQVEKSADDYKIDYIEAHGCLPHHHILVSTSWDYENNRPEKDPSFTSFDCSSPTLVLFIDDTSMISRGIKVPFPNEEWYFVHGHYFSFADNKYLDQDDTTATVR